MFLKDQGFESPATPLYRRSVKYSLPGIIFVFMEFMVICDARVRDTVVRNNSLYKYPVRMNFLVTSIPTSKMLINKITDSPAQIVVRIFRYILLILYSVSIAQLRILSRCRRFIRS